MAPQVRSCGSPSIPCPTETKMLLLSFLIGLGAVNAVLVQRQSTIDLDMNTAAQAAGKLYFGSATDNVPEFPDAQYVAILQQQSTFGQVTPGAFVIQRLRVMLFC